MLRSGNPYDSQRLTDKNIQNYILSSNLNYSDISLKSVNQLAIAPFLQKDFTNKVEGNCSISSITTCIYYHCPQHYDENVIYAATEAIASKYFYRPEKFGTIPFFIKTIYDQGLDYFQVPQKIKSKYINHIGFNFNTIKEQIDNKKPVILSMWNDGRDFYKSHSVVVVGYAQFNVFGNISSLFNQQKVKNMLLVYDNWTKKVSYVDPDIVSPISCIVY